MATSRSGRTGARAGGRPGGRNGGRRQPQKDNTLLYLEIGGAVVLAIVLIVVFAGRSGNQPPLKDRTSRVASEKPAPAPKEAPTPAPLPKSSSFDSGLKTLDGKPGKRPTRPCPMVNTAKGHRIYLEAKKLRDLSERQRINGNSALARKTLRQAYEKVEQAIAMVEDFNLWIEEADMNKWGVDTAVRKTKRTVDKWFKLSALIHKVLPKSD